MLVYNVMDLPAEMKASATANKAAKTVELMAAFEKLGAHDEKIYMEFDPLIPRPTSKVRIHNNKESIELKKIVTEDW